MGVVKGPNRRQATWQDAGFILGHADSAGTPAHVAVGGFSAASVAKAPNSNYNPENVYFAPPGLQTIPLLIFMRFSASGS